MSKKRIGTTTITLSIPTDLKTFFDELAEQGYNRSYLMLNMTRILQLLFQRRLIYPGGLHGAISCMLAGTRAGDLPAFRELEKKKNPVTGVPR